MNALNLLIGKKAKVLTDAKVVVELEIKSVETKDHSIDLEPATLENDWWPKSKDWQTIEVTFTNGFTKTYNSINEIELVEQ